jgi:hypothetical protein
MIPIGALLRKKKKKVLHQKSILTIDEQIAALENTIASASNEDYEVEIPVVRQAPLMVEKNKSGDIVKFLSESNLDRIEPLPSKYLPNPFASIGSKKKKKSLLDNSVAKKKTKKDYLGDQIISDTKYVNSNKLNGLETTIREMLKNYESLSGDKRPFYCRICRFQGTCIDDFNDHRQSEEHSIAAKIECKMSYCKLCRKQFTSPAQLKEHLQANPHKEKLAMVMSKQLSHKIVS